MPTQCSRVVLRWSWQTLFLSLSSAADGISEYVHAFVLAADSKAAAKVLSRELGFLRNGERDSDYRYRKGAGHVARAD